MNCPYCGKEAVKGYIDSRDEIVWKKGDWRGIFMDDVFYYDTVPLAEYSWLRASAVEAFYCPDCKKIVIDASGENCDLNKQRKKKKEKEKP